MATLTVWKFPTADGANAATTSEPREAPAGD